MQARFSILSVIVALCLASVLRAGGDYPICGDPDAGDCCEANFTPGCSDEACCKSVCALFPGCCLSAWNNFCTQQAADLCGCEGFCAPGNGECCEANGTPGCDDPECCNAVCDADPECCTQQWDDGCVVQAGRICGDLCAECGAPGIGSCCEAQDDNPACEDKDCCNMICDIDPTCCDDVWHQGCADLAKTMCEDCIPPTFLCGDPDAGSCFEPNGTPACSCYACCDHICNQDSFCCETAWDDICVAIGHEDSLCQDACGVADQCGWVGTGDCCTAHEDGACNDFNCCGTICFEDPFCCTNEWDDICVLEATEICTVCGGELFGSSCPGFMSVFTVQPATFDARAPLDDDGNLIGLGTTDEPITIKLLPEAHFHDPPMNPPLDCFHFCETDDGGYGPNAIESVLHTEEGFHTVTLARAITPGAVTVLRYQGGGLITFRAHPGNVNADAVAGVTDVLEIIDFLNGEGPEYSLYRLDLNHSSQVNGADVLTLIDVLNGAIGGQPWNLTPKPEPNEECP